MNLNIEPGCLALVVRHPIDENNGKVVTVGRYLGEINSDDNYRWLGKRWEVDRAIHAHSQLQDGPSNVYAKHIAEVCLLRIDGYEEPMAEQNTLEEAL
jgi:hypothetical protein